MNGINILKNGEQFARTIPPFHEEDTEAVATIIKWLQEGRWAVGNGVLQIINPIMEDDAMLDMINFDGFIDQVSHIIAHPSVIQLNPSQDKWIFTE